MVGSFQEVEDIVHLYLAAYQISGGFIPLSIYGGV